jgi:uncharacterized repeat protein (TIGR03833 family)
VDYKLIRLSLQKNAFKNMDGQNRDDIYPGLAVGIILKKDQRSGVVTYGIVQNLLTSSRFHSRGIKVRLEDGQIGRVVEIVEED